MADEPTTYTLNVYKKDDLKTVIGTGTDTDAKAAITGLTAGTVVADGDYVATHVDPTGVQDESEAEPVPGFTVPKQKAPAPTNLKSTPTADGATITAG
ncbi:hypothetical protein [Secundilactobacillus similis]|uniref:Uncharacterized protein n=1 Tax=Secundilactobacillus similis DSM 23365 = JCM 2765 TaxID=1423804 RepID=A0A0R2EWJ6_9LACO|nr:hypothetical protein [Secundilactobacillus similis]KRN20657.1 hypothetical protein FD14_GL001446 [Secundilactobacillus similis DSM 23365 = JCM 2765]